MSRFGRARGPVVISTTGTAPDAVVGLAATALEEAGEARVGYVGARPRFDRPGFGGGPLGLKLNGSGSPLGSVESPSDPLRDRCGCHARSWATWLRRVCRSTQPPPLLLGHGPEVEVWRALHQRQEVHPVGPRSELDRGDESAQDRPELGALRGGHFPE